LSFSAATTAFEVNAEDPIMTIEQVIRTYESAPNTNDIEAMLAFHSLWRICGK